MPYDLTPIRAPRLRGAALRAVVRLMELEPIGSIMATRLLKRMGVADVRRRPILDRPTYTPLVAAPGGEAPMGDGVPHHDTGCLDGLTDRPATGSALAIAAAFRVGEETPESVVDRAIAAIDAAAPKEAAIIACDRDRLRADARESASRLAGGTARSVLEGIPVAVKDELDVAGLPTRAGTRIINRVATTDATVVARLRSAGALIVGKAAMHEIGIGISGINPHFGTPRNAAAPGRVPGGSSSGSAAAVAAGIVPIAIGCDGGGSVRIPAATCGLYGLKPTWGRVSGHGDLPLAPSVGAAGPIAATVHDLALGYLAIAGPDANDPNTHRAPAPGCLGIDAGAEGLRIGVYPAWFEDAQEAIVASARSALAALEERGAMLVPVEIPELAALRTAHLVTITTEMLAAVSAWYPRHRASFGADTRLNLALARHLAPHDYIRAQQQRTRGIAYLEHAFRNVDVIATPTFAALPRPVPARRATALSDLAYTTATMRFTFLANLLGVPAITCPAEPIRAPEGGTIPVGIHFMAPHWHEAMLLRVARALERAR